MMKPIYEPKGRAKEYSDYALNIYTGCSHRCYYCFAPSVLRRERELFHTNVKPRENIIEETAKQIEKENITGKLIHLCFTCDPYPTGYDSIPTREIIKLLKQSGNHVQILTKNGEDAMRDFDLLDENDWFGITYAGYPFPGYTSDPNYIPEEEPGSGAPYYRLKALHQAHKQGIKTWVSAEPVLNATNILNFIECADYVNLWKIGKLNYHPSSINWKSFGQQVERLLMSKSRAIGCQYYIKESLRTEMNKTENT